MKTNYLADTPRALDVIVGIALAMVDFLFVAVLGLLLHRVLAGKTLPGAVWIIIVLALMALGCGVVCWRLLCGHRRRSDGGLFSPFFLRSASLIFLLGAALSVWVHPAGILELMSAVGLASTCFVLARHREQNRASSQSGAPIEPA